MLHIEGSVVPCRSNLEIHAFPAFPAIGGPGAVSEDRQRLICIVYRVPPVIYSIGVVLMMMNSG